ncbi:hypothetical protein ACFQ4O_07555 [Methylopila musalis]|uniref:Uncharacterized protein n=1 Tax=Methylopila musalis TaxID=1134781 RepID=A0ABW3Z6G8_9HYPH
MSQSHAHHHQSHGAPRRDPRPGRSLLTSSIAVRLGGAAALSALIWAAAFWAMS